MDEPHLCGESFTAMALPLFFGGIAEIVPKGMERMSSKIKMLENFQKMEMQ